jgi:hypothetical protein
MTDSNEPDSGSKLKIHKVHQILEDEDGVYINCFIEVEDSLFDIDLYVPDLNEAYKIKTWCDNHIEPFEIMGDIE